MGDGRKQPNRPKARLRRCAVAPVGVKLGHELQAWGVGVDFGENYRRAEIVDLAFDYRESLEIARCNRLLKRACGYVRVPAQVRGIERFGLAFDVQPNASELADGLQQSVPVGVFVGDDQRLVNQRCEEVQQRGEADDPLGTRLSGEAGNKNRKCAKTSAALPRRVTDSSSGWWTRGWVAVSASQAAEKKDASRGRVGKQ